MQGLSPSIRTHTLMVAGGVAVLVVVLLLYVFCTQWFIDTVNYLLSPIVSRTWLNKLTGTLQSGASGLGALKQPQLVAGIIACSLASWVVNGIVIHLALWSFDLPNSLLISCIVLGLTAVGAALPAAPGYLGVIQLCFMTVLGLFTTDEAGVFAASIYYHLTEYIMVTLTGLCYFNTTGVTLAEVQAEASVIEEQGSLEEQAGSNPDLADVGRGCGR